MSREDVFIANVLKCRPPGNRDPLPEEIASCEPHLFRQLELIRPTVVATLGNFATKLLSGKPTGITRVHGVEQQVTIGAHPVVLFPLYHPAAALYTRAMLGVLEEDFRKLPALLGARARRGPARAPTPVAAGRRARARSRLEPPSRSWPSSSACSSGRSRARPPEETEAIAAALAASLRAGDVVTVSGELGAGKTTFVRGACRALGVTEPVTSPTFTIGHRYAARVRVAHLDLYRFHGLSAAEWGDLEPYFDDDDRLRRVARGGRGGASRAAGARRGSTHADETHRGSTSTRRRVAW